MPLLLTVTGGCYLGATVGEVHWMPALRPLTVSWHPSLMRRGCSACVAVLVLCFLLDDASGAFTASRNKAERHLQCSACKLTAESIQQAMVAKSSPSLSAGKKAALASKVLKAVCDNLQKKQIAVVGPEGKQSFVDFNDIMRKGGSVDNLSMGPEHTEKAIGICNELVNAFEDILSEKMAKAPRVYDYKLEQDLCSKLSGACGTKAKSEL